MVREGSAPNFCPPTEEGVTIALVDEKGEQVELEFLGLVLKGESSFGFFFPIDDEHPATSSGEVVVLEVSWASTSRSSAARYSPSKCSRRKDSASVIACTAFFSSEVCRIAVASGERLPR
jgi:hypothetical protein